ncbi:E3 ubiquitin-protein ligase rnf213-alpha-like [Mytilus galloprovincialis]|uniref:E3 ubiquitin-protein ligase rnf213-alpha-like n=1 Tax=Mytilus galloprovincialis TaxID=29158 RepID=UPI003F7B635F
MANALGTCPECGAMIGGQSYRINADNINDTGEDETQRGHVLGSATNLKPVDALYRKLSKASVAILRLLTHMSMYIGTNTNIQEVCQTIKPPIDPGDVYDYLLLHLNLDLTSVQAILGINRDDAVLFLHFLLVKIMDTLKDQTLSRDMSGLLSKESRAKWEEQFANRYIEPFLQDVKTKLNACNQMLVDDQRLV